MLGFVIGDHDMITGFRLVGIKGVEVSSADAARQALAKALGRRDLAIVVVSEEFSNQIRDDIDKARLDRNSPLIVEVPGSMGPSGETTLSNLISKTLGMRI